MKQSFVAASLILPTFPGDHDPDLIINAHVSTNRLGPGRLDHVLTLDAKRRDTAVWTKTITFKIEAPFEVPDLPVLDPFVIAALFPVMEIGGTLRVHGPVSRTLIRNVLDFQSAWYIGAPDYFKMFVLEVAAIEDIAVGPDGPDANAIVAFTAGVDAMLALCRNASGDAGPAGYKIGASLYMDGIPLGHDGTDPAPLIADLRRISADWDVPLAVVDTNIAEVVRKGDFSHGTWLAACLMLFGGRFDVGILGSTKLWFSRGWELFGSHPLLDQLLSTGLMSIRNDEGVYHRSEKVSIMMRYPNALRDLRVCLDPPANEHNCCRCEKCVRTMLCFVANGDPIPAAFPHPVRVQDIGPRMGSRSGLQWTQGILDCAKRNGTLDNELIKVLRRRYRIKQFKVMIKVWAKALMKRKAPPKWYIFDKN